MKITPILCIVLLACALALASCSRGAVDHKARGADHSADRGAERDASSPAPAVSSEEAQAEVGKLLVAFHHKAAVADFEGYFALFDEQGVFLGTDATERWPVAAFREFARPHFQGKSAWVFVPEKQNITVSRDGRFAWFDEELRSQKYGQCRGSGVVIRTDQGWRIGQYNLTVPIPNDLMLEVVARIRDQGSAARAPGASPASPSDGGAASR